MVGIGRLKKTQKQHLNPTTASVDGIFRESGLTALFMGNFFFCLTTFFLLWSLAFCNCPCKSQESA